MKKLKKVLSLVLLLCTVIGMIPNIGPMYSAEITPNSTGTDYSMGGNDIPIKSFDIILSLDGHEYKLEAKKENGEIVYTGMDELNAAYPDGVPADTPAYIEIFFDPSNVEFVQGDRIVYQLPSIINVTVAASGTIYDQATGAIVLATFTIGTDGSIVFIPNADAGERFIDGAARFAATFNPNHFNDDGDAPVLIGGMEIVVPIEEEEVVHRAEYTLTKGRGDSNKQIGTDSVGTYITWTMCVSAAKTNDVDVTGVTVRDIIPDNMLQYYRTDDQGRPYFVYWSGYSSNFTTPRDESSRFVWDDVNGCWTWVVSDVAPGKSRYMVFKAYIKDDVDMCSFSYENPLKNTIESYRNGEKEHSSWTRQYGYRVIYPKKFASAPYLDENGDVCIDYTIYGSPYVNNGYNIDARGVELLDVFTSGAEYIKDVKNFKYYIYHYMNKSYAAGHPDWYWIGQYALIPYDQYGTYCSEFKPESTEYPEEYKAVWDPETSTVHWIIDRVPTTDSMMSGVRYLMFTVVLDWDLGADSTSAIAEIPTISNTVKHADPDRYSKNSQSLSKTISKQWIFKSGEAVDSKTTDGRNGAVKYTVEIQKDLVVKGHYVLKDELASGAMYFENSNYHGVVLTRKQGSTADASFKVEIPFRNAHPTTDADGNKVYVNTVTEDGMTFTLTLTEGENGSVFTLDIPETDEAWTYDATYVAVPTSSATLKTMSNSASIGRVGDDGEIIWHITSVDSSIEDSAFIRKEGAGFNESANEISWKLTVENNIREGATIIDQMDEELVAKEGYGSFYYTQEQIDAIEVKVGDEVLEKAVDYNVAFFENKATSFIITFLHDIAVSTETPLTVLAKATADEFELEEGEELLFPNNAQYNNGSLSAETSATQPAYRSVRLVKVAALSETAGTSAVKYTVENGKLYIYWWLSVNTDGDMEGAATVTDLLPAGLKFDSVYLHEFNFAENVTFEASCTVDDETGRDLVTIELDGLEKMTDESVAPTLVLLEMKTEVTNDEALTASGGITFTNTAVLNYRGAESVATGEANLERTVIEKRGVYSAPYVEYTVEINKEGVDLQPNEGVTTITVVDTYDSRLDFKKDSLVVMRADGSVIPASALKLVEDKDNFTFSFVIPDNETITVTYRCQPAGEVGDPAYHVLNSMKFYGLDKSSTESDTLVLIANGSGSIDVVKSISIRKLDDDGEKLAGAKFALYEVTASADGLVYTLADVIRTTDETGFVRFYGNGGSNVGLDKNKVYAYKEVEAPAGYVLTESNSAYHYVAFSKAPINAAFRTAFAKTHPGHSADTDIVMSASAFATDMYNRKGQIKVVKNFDTTEYHDGVYYFGLFDSDGTTLLKVGSIVISNGSPRNELVFRGLDFGTDAQGNPDGSEKTYYVYETDANGGKLTRDADGKVVVNGMTFTVSGEGAVTISGTESESSATITITNTPGRCSIQVTKAWNDDDDRDGLRPESVTVELLANGNPTGTTVTLSEKNDWTDFFNNLLDTKNGRVVTYTVREITVADYEVVITGNKKDGFVISNTHNPDTTSISVEKVWDDNNDQDGMRAEYEVTLYANGQPVADSSVTLGKDQLSYTWNDLPVNENGEKIVYTVKETIVPEGYESSTDTAFAAVEDGKAVITNTHKPETKSVSVSKVWNDSDLAGVSGYTRPSSVSVTLTGKVGSTTVYTKTQTVSANGNWMVEFKDLAVYNNGKKIEYTVSELTVDGYTVKVDGTTVTNTPDESEKINPVELVIVKTDALSGGVLPEAVFEITKDGVSYGTVKTGSDGKATFKFTSEGTYVISEESAPVGYTKSQQTWTVEVKKSGIVSVSKTDAGIWEKIYDLIFGSVEGSFKDGVLTISDTPNLIEVAVEKVWDDADDQDGLRDEFEVELYADGVAVAGSKKTLKPGESWTWTELPEYKDGNKVVYTVKETKVPAGYTSSTANGNAAVTNGVAVITNKHTPSVTSVSVEKVWDDANDQDGKRDSYTVTLFANGEPVEGSSVTLDKDQTSYTWNDLPEFKEGKKIVYTVKETGVPSGYTSSTDEEAAAVTDGKAVITNKYTPGVVSVTVNKVWNDNGNQDGMRDSYEVTLFADGEPVEGSSVTLTKDQLTYTWTGLPEYKDGNKVVYTVVETKVPENYTSSTDNSAAAVTNGVATVTNTHVPEVTEREVEKIWDDAGLYGQAGYSRPDEIVIVLTGVVDDVTVGTYTQKVREADGWKARFSQLPKYDNGKLIEYKVSEQSVDGYTVTADGLTIKNTPVETEKITPVELRIMKTDANTGNGLAGAIFEVTKDGVSLGTTEATTADGVTVFSFTSEGTYVISEFTAPEGYKKSTETWTIVVEKSGIVSVSLNADNVFEKLYNLFFGVDTEYANGVLTVENTPNTVDISVSKVWDDANNQDGKRDAYEVTLYADGEPVEGSSVTLGKDQTSYTWKALPEYKDGKKIVYTVKETKVPEGYTSSTANENAAVDDGTATITNKYTPGVVSVTVEKKWVDADNQDGMRDTYEVTLYADGEEVENSAVSLNADQTTYTWNDLPEYKDGKKIVYTVVETKVPEGYESSTAEGAAEVADGKATIVNKHTPSLISVSVEKIWDDADDQDGKRDAYEVTLYADGQPVEGSSVTLDADQTTYTWNDLPEYKEGKKIVYTVVETKVPAGYTSSTANGAAETVDGKATITNKYTPGKVSVSVEKIWDDADDQDGLRDAFEVTLYADGQPVAGSSVTLDAETTTYTWTDLDEYKSGKKIVYTVVETKVPDEYTSSTANGAAEVVDGKATITNTHEPHLVSVSVEKIWDDADNQDGKRDAYEVTLYADGEPVEGSSVTLDAETTSYTWSDLPERKNGQLIVYTVVETKVPAEYTSSTANGAAEVVDGKATITNTHVPSLISVSVEKFWNDADDQDGLRDAYEVTLYADGQPVEGSSVTLDADQTTYTWNDLPEYKEGKKIVYTVVETKVPDEYTSSTAEEGAEVVDGKATITNSHDPHLVSVSVEKIWDDNDNQDGKRDAFEVTLYADGEPVEGSSVTLDAETTSYTWSDLPERKNGELIVYTVVETKVPEGYTSSTAEEAAEVVDGKATITNTHEIEKTEITVTKTWSDDDNRDGIRPDYVTVQLLANGEEYGEPVDLSDENDWQHTWTDMDVYANGEFIVYSAVEVAVEGYEADYGEDGLTITNKHESELVDFTVTKVWDDDNDKDGIRPDYILVQLYANGEEYGEPVVLGHMPEEEPEEPVVPADPVEPGITFTATDGEEEETDEEEVVEPDPAWTYTWTDLYKYENGEEIVYTVEEVEVPNKYTSTTEYSEDGYSAIINNFHVPRTGDDSHVGVWSLIFLMSAAGIVEMIRRKYGFGK